VKDSDIKHEDVKASEVEGVYGMVMEQNGYAQFPSGIWSTSSHMRTAREDVPLWVLEQLPLTVICFHTERSFALLLFSGEKPYGGRAC
jgi:hypothetical protein